MQLSVLNENQLDEMLEMYQRRVAHNISNGTTQWQSDEVTWNALSKDYKVEDFRVLLLDNKIIAAMAIVDEDTLYWPNMSKGDSLYLHKICVDPNYEGHGYGDVMVSMFIEEGRSKHKKDVRLDVRAHKDALVSLYERNGFELHEEKYIHKEFKTRLYIYTYAYEKEDDKLKLEDTMWTCTGITHVRHTVRVFAKKDNKYALLKIRGTDEFRSRKHYETPGGGIEIGESPLLAIHREIYEELGCLCKVKSYLGCVQDSYHLIERTTISKFYEVEVKEELGYTSYTEDEQKLVQAIVWVTKDKLLETIQPFGMPGIGYLIHRRDYLMGAELFRSDNNLKYIVVKKVIDEWDPICLLSSGAPNDEYDGESMRIYTEAIQIVGLDAIQLSQVIQRVFIKMFFDDVANIDQGTYQMIAKRILHY